MTNAVQSPDSPAPRVIVGLSGGVDSSVAALLLKEQGYQVEALFMKNWDEADGTEHCTVMEDLADAQAVAGRLGIALYTVSFSAEYWDRVFEHFLSEYGAGRTPNPDILCNREIKFRAFLDHALTMGADYIATGHYAQCRVTDSGAQLLRGADLTKDQSYFLHAVPGTRIARTLFPLGHMHKTQVRLMAEEAGLVTHDKKDSTGICFIGERRFSDFLKTYLPAQPGPIETPEGHVIGRHQGLMYHTIGQRQGLGIGGLNGFGSEPWYVAEKDVERNVLIAVQGDQHPLLYSRGLYTWSIDWVDAAPSLPLRCVAKTRYRQPDQPCVLEAMESGYRVVFDQPQRAVTPGQSVVFYLSDLCLGGGVIERTFREAPAGHHDTNAASA